MIYRVTGSQVVIYLIADGRRDMQSVLARRLIRRTHHTSDVEALVRLMVLNRLCDPVTGLSTISTEQNEVLHELEMEKPAAPEQLALL